MGEFSLSDNQLFMKKQIDNTISIINKFFDDKELSYTALQNALLSLVLLPYESAKKRDKTRLWQGKYEDIKKALVLMMKSLSQFLNVKMVKSNLIIKPNIALSKNSETP